MTKKVIDPAPIIKELADRCLEAKGLECSILGKVIDRLRAAPAVHNAPYWATEAAYKNGYEAGKRDAVEVAHGRWEDMYGGKYVNPRYRCSVCKEKALFKLERDVLGNHKDVQALTPCCPYCMAKLDGGTNNDI